MSPAIHLNGLVHASPRAALLRASASANSARTARAVSTSRRTTNAQFPALLWIVDPWKRFTVHPAFLRIQSRLRSRWRASPLW